MRDLKKQIRHCNIIPSYLPKWVFLEQTETVFGETKTIFQWKRRYGHNGTTPTSHKYTKNPKPKTLSKFRQHQFQILIKTGVALHKHSDTMFGYTGYSQKNEHLEQLLHTNRSHINTLMFVTWLKPSRGK